MTIRELRDNINLLSETELDNPVRIMRAESFPPINDNIIISGVGFAAYFHNKEVYYLMDYESLIGIDPTGAKLDSVNKNRMN
jgi:hypothetical protein